MTETEGQTQNNEPPVQKSSIVALIASTLAAAFGVQSNKNRERDFQQSSIWPFVFAGVLFTMAFVLALVVIVSVILS